MLFFSRFVKGSRLFTAVSTVSRAAKRESKAKFSSLGMRGGSSSSDTAGTGTGTTYSDLKIEDFEILEEREAYAGRYRQMIEKSVRGPDGKKMVFDILSNNKMGGVTMFVWCTKTRTGE